ncbi:hypothetical protein [Candidatus Chlorohelix sp.]
MAEHRTQISYNSPWMKMREEFGTLLGSNGCLYPVQINNTGAKTRI